MLRKRSNDRPSRLSRLSLAAGMVCLVLAIGLTVSAAGFQAARLTATAPGLGTAASFAVLGGSTVTNTGATVVDGDLGVWPGTEVTGFPPGEVTGTIHAGDEVAEQAQSDVTIAYEDLAGQACDFDLTGQDLGGQTLVPGVYCFDTSAQLTGVLTLDAEGDPSAVWVFQIGSTLTTASNSSVAMINAGDQGPCYVFWQVGSSATLGTDTVFAGNILALTSITLDTGAQMEGRALARNGAVTMDTNNISMQICEAEPPTPTPDATPTGTPDATPTGTPDATPTGTPDATPTGTPVVAPTDTPVVAPTDTPVVAPTDTPVVAPTATPLTILPESGGRAPHSGQLLAAGLAFLGFLGLALSGFVLRRRRGA